MRKSYPSDITKKQFEIVRKDLEQATKSTHPRKYDLYDIFCAVLYLIKEGCSWRAIPHDFPKWENVRYHYDIWSKEDDNGISLLDKVLRKLVKAERERQGRETSTTMLIIDSKTTQNADTAETKGYDAAKKSGIKIHIGVDILGLPHMIMLTPADVTDRKVATWMIEYYSDVTENLKSLIKVMADGGYTGKNFSDSVNELCRAEVEIVKRNELHTFVVLPKRWIVERSFAWLDKCRRLWKNCERKLHTSFQMVTLAFIRLLLNRY